MTGWIMARGVCVFRVIPISNLRAMEKTLSNHAASFDGQTVGVTVCHAWRIGRDTEFELLISFVTGKAIDLLG